MSRWSDDDRCTHPHHPRKHTRKHIAHTWTHACTQMHMITEER
jgi:hypothetical protein